MLPDNTLYALNKIADKVDSLMKEIKPEHRSVRFCVDAGIILGCVQYLKGELNVGRQQNTETNSASS